MRLQTRFQSVVADHLLLIMQEAVEATAIVGARLFVIRDPKNLAR